MRANLIDERMGAGNAIQSISREINQACTGGWFRTEENPAWALHPGTEEPRRWELLPCRYTSKPTGPPLPPAAPGGGRPPSQPAHDLQGAASPPCLSSLSYKGSAQGSSAVKWQQQDSLLREPSKICGRYFLVELPLCQLFIPCSLYSSN